MKPTQVLKHIGQLNNLPKKCGFKFEKKFLKGVKILPYRAILVMPYANNINTKIII